jgi:hypothetical protein
MAQEDDGYAEMEKALKIFGVIFVAHHQAAKVEGAIRFSSGEHSDAGGVHLASTRAGSLCLAQSFRHLTFASALHPSSHCRRLCRQSDAPAHRPQNVLPAFAPPASLQLAQHFLPQSERKTVAVWKAHDLGALAALGLPNQASLFDRNKGPGHKTFLKNQPACTPEVFSQGQQHFFKSPQRVPNSGVANARFGTSISGWQILPRGTRFVKSTARPQRLCGDLLHGRSRPAARTLSTRKMFATIFYCSSC